MISERDYLIIISTANALVELEDHLQWNLSLGEQLSCVKSTHAYLVDKGLPKAREEWVMLFQKMYRETWGPDHDNGEVHDDEIEVLKSHLVDVFEV